MFFFSYTPCTIVNLLLQETARLESETFVQQQKVAMSSELKAVLDSWVRYEQQVKEGEQADLVKAVMDKVNAGLKDERTQKEILAAAVAEIECKVSFCCTRLLLAHGRSSQCSSRTRVFRRSLPELGTIKIK
jgi:hypothetical protein